MKPDREEVLRVASETGVLGGYEGEPEFLERFAAHFFEAGARAEREECATLCEKLEVKNDLQDNPEYGSYGEFRDCASAIRARTTP